MLAGISTTLCGHGTEGKKSADFRLGTETNVFCRSDQ